MKLILTILILFITWTSHSQERLVPKMNNPIEGNQLVVDYSDDYKIPIMVYYIIDHSKLGSYGRYSFHKLRYQSAADSWQYTNNGYDKGHMMSSASSNSYESNMESFDMINIVPQTSSFNRGIWKKTELFERCNSSPYCHVICGVILDGTEDSINGITIPKSFYKVIYNPIKNKMIGFLLSQGDTGNIGDFVVTVDFIESLINLDLFYQLPDNIEDKLECDSSINDWN